MLYYTALYCAVQYCMFEANLCSVTFTVTHIKGHHMDKVSGSTSHHHYVHQLSAAHLYTELSLMASHTIAFRAYTHITHILCKVCILYIYCLCCTVQ